MLRSEVSLRIPDKDTIHIRPSSARILQGNLDVISGVREAIKTVDGLIERPEAVLIPRPPKPIIAGSSPRIWHSRNPTLDLAASGETLVRPREPPSL